MLQLVRVHNRSDGLNSTIDDIEFDDADETILRVQEYRTRLAVHIYSSEPAADGLALGKDAVNQSRHAIPSGVLASRQPSGFRSEHLRGPPQRAKPIERLAARLAEGNVGHAPIPQPNGPPCFSHRS